MASIVTTGSNAKFQVTSFSTTRAIKTATSNRSNRELELRRDWFAFYLRHQHYGTRRKKAENSQISRSVRRYFVCARIADVFRYARNETCLLRANLVRYLFCMVDMDHDGDALLDNQRNNRAFQSSIDTEEDAFRAFSLASSISAPSARVTPMRRFPTTFGLPKSRN